MEESEGSMRNARSATLGRGVACTDPFTLMYTLLHPGK
jgi:hypothetical protein